MEHSEVIARLAVQDLLARYTSFGDTGDAAGYGSLFGEHGVLEVVGAQTVTGARQAGEVMQGFFDNLPPGFSPYRHHLSSIRITVVDPTRASAVSYFAVIAPYGLDHWGTYVDDIELTNGQWTFARRVVTVEGALPQSPFEAIVQATTPRAADLADPPKEQLP